MADGRIILIGILITIAIFAAGQFLLCPADGLYAIFYWWLC